MKKTASKWLYSLQLLVSRFWLLVLLHRIRIYSYVNIVKLRLSIARNHRASIAVGKLGDYQSNLREALGFPGNLRTKFISGLGMICLRGFKQ